MFFALRWGERLAACPVHRPKTGLLRQSGNRCFSPCGGWQKACRVPSTPPDSRDFAPKRQSVFFRPAVSGKRLAAWPVYRPTAGIFRQSGNRCFWPCGGGLKACCVASTPPENGAFAPKRQAVFFTLRRVAKDLPRGQHTARKRGFCDVSGNRCFSPCGGGLKACCVASTPPENGAFAPKRKSVFSPCGGWQKACCVASTPPDSGAFTPKRAVLLCRQYSWSVKSPSPEIGIFSP